MATDDEQRRLYTLYIDETGTHGITPKALTRDRHFCLFGTIIRRADYVATVEPRLRGLKNAVFGPGGESRIILHQREIDDRSGDFSVFADRSLRHRFHTAMVEFLKQEPLKFIAIAIDKQYHVGRYGANAWNPYSYTARLLLERFCLFLRCRKAVGMIRAESRSTAEDDALEAEFQTYRTHGTPFVDAPTFNERIPVPRIHFLPKTANVVGLQISDVLANMALEEMMVETGRKKRITNHSRMHYLDAIRDKWDTHPTKGEVWGCGKVFVPRNT